MGRAGIEPATLGLKVPHFEGKPDLKKRRFKPLNKPRRILLETFRMAVSSPRAVDMSRFAMHARHCVAFCS
jgi:hypothetical protein